MPTGVPRFGVIARREQARFRTSLSPGAQQPDDDKGKRKLLYEPFYQLMRMLLLGDRMLTEGVTEALRVEDVRVVVVCPTANDDYRRVVPATPLGRRSPGGATVRDAMRVGLRDPRRLDVVAQNELVVHIRRGPLSDALKPWLDYHALRYGW